MLHCYILKLMLMYEDLENIKADLVNTVVFNLHLRTFSLGHSVQMNEYCYLPNGMSLIK